MSEVGIVVDLESEKTFSFNRSLLDHKVVEVLSGLDKNDRRVVRNLVGMYFDIHNADFITALKNDWIDSEGRPTEKGRAEFEKRQRNARSRVSGLDKFCEERTGVA